MAKKYDWENLKKQFILGEYLNLRDFSEKAKVPYTLLRQNAKNWVKEKRTKAVQKANKIIEKTIEQQAKKEADWNTRHLEAFGIALEKCEIILDKELNAHTDMFGKTHQTDTIQISKLAKVVETLEKIQKGQRLAEGRDKPGFEDDNEAKTIEVVFTRASDNDRIKKLEQEILSGNNKN